ncbi:MAG: class I SAM-dependent methyltransferase [Acidimicrobiales bacterium]
MVSRVALADVPPPDQYFRSEPTVASDERTVDLVLPDLRLTLHTDRGVFSRDGVDLGTRLLLLDGPAPTPGDRVLVDVGAGYGPIACALAVRNPEAEVWAVEVNRRARDLCRANATAAGLTNMTVVDPAEVPDGLVADRIWSNPPIRIGKPALRGLLTGWLDRLAPNGSAHLVIQRHLGADSMQAWLRTRGWRVDRRRSAKGYRLFDVEHQAGVTGATGPTGPPSEHSDERGGRE